jgi:DNA-directed RNA polymerase specialized sigma24 family protein
LPLESVAQDGDRVLDPVPFADQPRADHGIARIGDLALACQGAADLVGQQVQARDRLASGADPDEVADSGDSGIGAAGYARLNGAVRKLLGDDALLVIRVAIEGFSQAEVAVELGLTEAAARKRYQRAMRRLNDALQEIP